MASGKQYAAFVLDQLSDLDGVSCRAMMGEYLLYVQGKLVGGIYDDRLLVKQTQAARRLMPDAPLEMPYEGAKEMLLVERMDDRAFLKALLLAIANELPPPRPKRKAAPLP